MKAILKAARACAIFVGASGFLFGQLYFGTFSLAATIAGVSGVLAGALSWLADRNARLKRVVFVCCAAGLLGVAMDAYHYYTELHRPGNYYAWFLIGPYIATLLLIGWHALRNDDTRRPPRFPRSGG